MAHTASSTALCRRRFRVAQLKGQCALALYGHPFSSYTQKVLIALYENGTPFEFRCLWPESQHSAEWLKRWPLRKFPLLVDVALAVNQQRELA